MQSQRVAGSHMHGVISGAVVQLYHGHLYAWGDYGLVHRIKACTVFSIYLDMKLKKLLLLLLI